MVFIKVDMKKLQAFIFNLQDWQNHAEIQRDKVKKKVDVEDPANILSIVNSGAWLDKLTKHLNSLRGSLETRRLNVEAVNKASGISLTSDECGYYLPDGVEDNTANVTAYNIRSIENGKKLAAQFDEACAKGKTKDGKTPEQIMAEIAKHQDVPTFGVGVLNHYSTPENFLMSVEHNYQDLCKQKGDENAGNPLMTMYGHLFAAATQFGDGKYGQRLANEYANHLQTNKTSQGNDIATFNELLSVPGTIYGTDFLYTAGARLEDLDPSKVQPTVPPHYFRRHTTSEPLVGVLDAMGRNPEAALKYLADEGSMDGEYWKPSDKAIERWKKLTSRKDPAFVDSFSSALAAASGYRNTSNDPNDPLYDSSAKGGHRKYIKNGDARATWLTGVGLRHFSEDMSADKFTEKMKANVGTMLANSPEELAAASLRQKVGEGGNNEGPTINGKANDIVLTKLLYRVIDNDSAASSVNAALGAYHHKKIERMKQDGQVHSGGDLANLYRQAAATQSYLQVVSKTKLDDAYKDNQAEYEKRKSRTDTANAVFSTVAVAGVTAATVSTGGTAAVLLPAATGVGLSIAGPFDPGFYQKRKAGLPDVGENSATSLETLRMQAYTDAAEKGFLYAPHLDSAKKAGVIKTDSSGTKIIPRDPSSFSHDDALSMNSWADAAGADGSKTDSKGQSIPKDGNEGTVAAIDQAITQGSSYGKNNTEEVLNGKDFEEDRHLK